MPTAPEKPAFGSQPWKDGPLYTFLLDLFPQHRSVCGFLDVLRLSKELSKSHEAVYKWLRTSKLTPQNADAIRDLAARLDPDAHQLSRQDFDRFVYA